MAARAITVELIVDEDGAVRGFKRADGSAEKFENTLDSTASTSRRFGNMMKAAAGTAAAAVGVMAVQAGMHLFRLGSSIEETASQFEKTFGDASEQVDEFIKDFGSLAGFTEKEGRKVTATLGAMAQGFGLTEEASADFAMEAVRLASDLSSFWEVPFQETLDALRSGLIGEVEPLQRFGITLDADTVKARALAGSLADTEKELTQQEKVLARLQIAYKQAGDAIGDVEDTQNSTARQSVRLRTQFRQMQEDIANELMPAFRELNNRVFEFAVDNKDEITNGLRSIASALTTVVTGALQFAAVMERVTQRGGGQGGMGSFLRALPVGQMIAVTRALSERQRIMEDLQAGPPEGLDFMRTGADFSGGVFDPSDFIRMGETFDPEDGATAGLEEWMDRVAKEAGLLADSLGFVVDENDKVVESFELWDSVGAEVDFQSIVDAMEGELKRLDQLIQLGVIDPQQRAAHEAQILEQALTQMVEQGVGLTREEVERLQRRLQEARQEMERIGDASSETRDQAIQAFTPIEQGFTDILKSAGFTEDQIARVRREISLFGQMSNQELTRLAQDLDLSTQQVKALEAAFQQLHNHAMQLAGAIGQVFAGFIEGSRSAVQAALAQTVAIAIRQAFATSGNPLLGAILAPAAAAAAKQAFDELVPEFRTGVTNFEGGMARVHEDELLVNLAPGTNVIPATAARGAMQGAQLLGQPADRRQAVNVRTQADVNVRAEPTDWFDIVTKVERYQEIRDQLQ